jgi:hypothetical protein
VDDHKSRPYTPRKAARLQGQGLKWKLRPVITVSKCCFEEMTSATAGLAKVVLFEPKSMCWYSRNTETFGMYIHSAPPPAVHPTRLDVAVSNGTPAVDGEKTANWF